MVDTGVRFDRFREIKHCSGVTSTVKFERALGQSV